MLLEATSHYHSFISKILQNVAKLKSDDFLFVRARNTISFLAKFFGKNRNHIEADDCFSKLISMII